MTIEDGGRGTVDGTRETFGSGMTSLEDRIIAMEQRVLNAPTIGAARNFHDQLDRLYEKRGDKIARSRMSTRPGKHGPAKTVSAEYERGYQAGYHAGQRQVTKREDCNHEGIGLPWCPTCGPRTRADLARLGVRPFADDAATPTSPEKPEEAK